MPLSNRTYGVEIEFIGSFDSLKAALTSLGIPSVINQNDDHSDFSQWKITPDGSVHNGGELISPILRGTEGLGQITTVCQALVQAGCSVNQHCGLHVHVDGSDLTVQDAVNIIKRYADNENRIDAVVPVARRLNRNQWCRSLAVGITNDCLRRMLLQTDIQRAGLLMPSGKHSKVSLVAYSRQKTIEFRHHSGTLNAEKINNWIQFCVNFLETSKEVEYTVTENIPPARLSMAQTSLLRTLSQNCCYSLTSNSSIVNARGPYTTEEELAAAVQSLRDAGYNVHSTTSSFHGDYSYVSCDSHVEIRTRQVTRRGIHPNSHGNPFFGLEPELISYFDERANDFAA